MTTSQTLMISHCWSILTVTVRIEVFSSGLLLLGDNQSLGLSATCHDIKGDREWVGGRVERKIWAITPTWLKLPQVSPTYPPRPNKVLNEMPRYIENGVCPHFLPWHLFSSFFSLWTCSEPYPVFGTLTWTVMEMQHWVVISQLVESCVMAPFQVYIIN